MSLLLEDGSIYSWGFNEKGQLGIGNNQNQSIPQKVKTTLSQIISITCGDDHSAVLTSIKYNNFHSF